MMKTILAAAAALALGTGIASAAVVTNLGDGAAAYAFVDANQGTTLEAGATITPGLVKTGNSLIEWRSPYDPSGDGPYDANWDTYSYFSVGPSTSSPATLQFSGLRAGLKMLWGSIDGYNTMKFYNGATLVATVTNLDVLPSSTEAAGTGASYVSITGLEFDSVDFYSTSNAFEFANVSAVAIPLPAGGLLLISALGAVVVTRRRKTA